LIAYRSTGRFRSQCGRRTASWTEYCFAAARTRRLQTL